jgi:predicted alpha/beta hydrolase
VVACSTAARASARCATGASRSSSRSPAFPTLSYDYRGIGVSRRASLRGFAPRSRTGRNTTARRDRWLRERYPRRRIVGIAHSIGALMAGRRAQLFRAGAAGDDRGHTGYYGDYTRATGCR